MPRIADFIAGRTPLELYETYLVPGLFTLWAEEIAAIPAPTSRRLDLACGSGAVSRALARRLSPENQVVAVDVAPAMPDCARRFQLSGCARSFSA